VGKNSRLDALQAAVLEVKLDHLDEWNRGRQRNAALYRELLSGVVTTPSPASHQTCHVFNQFVIRCARRDELRTYLAGAGVGTEVYYPLPLHLQPALAGLGYKASDFPVSEQLAKESLALPIFAELTRDEVAAVAGLIREFYERR
jgi:dTDP-4-amino-4,6-dideoxygalactose transaminase